MSAGGNGQITHAGFGLWRQRLDGPAREDIQSELAKADRYVHSADGIQKTGSELKFEGFPLRVRRAVQCRFHKDLLNQWFLRLVSSRSLFQSASDKTKSKASMLAARCAGAPHPIMGTTSNGCEHRNASTRLYGRHHICARNRDILPGNKCRQIRSEERYQVGHIVVGAAPLERHLLDVRFIVAV